MPFRFNPLRPRSIRGQLVALIVALAAPLIALQAWWAFDQYRDAERAADLEALVVADATATSIRQFMATAEDLLTSLADELAVEWIAQPDCNDGVGRATRAVPFLVNLMVIGSDGEILCSAKGSGRDDSAANWHWWGTVRDSGSFTVGAPLLGTYSGEWVLPLAAPIRDDQGAVIGALAGSMPLVGFGPFLADGFGQDQEQDQLVTVATPERIVLARSHDAERWVGQELPPSNGNSRSVAPGREVARGQDFEGIERSWGQVTMERGWIVYVGVPLDAIIAPARAAFARQMGLMLLIFGISVAFVLNSYRRIGGALGELAAGVGIGPGPDLASADAAPTEFRDVVQQFATTLASRRDAEAAERAARERYQSIFDNAVFGLYVSSFDGRFIQVNPALVSMLGYESAEALMEAGPGALYPATRVREELVKAASQSGEIVDWEIDWLKADGLPITVRLNGRTITGTDGENLFEMIVQDITDEKRTEGELRQTQKMEAIGKLAGGIAHDFNNLLTVIGGNLELLEEGLPVSHELRPDVEQIRDATARAGSLTSQLLAFARREPREARAVPVNDVLQEVERLLVRLIGEDIALETRLAGDVGRVSIDPGELEQVVMNLVLNARDAMPMGGRITVETRAAPGDDTQGEVEGGQEGVVLTVRDTGVGMDYETSKRIFEPFYTTKPMGEGTGLGLSTVYGIVQRAGGHIQVESEPGYGTSIEIWLPLVGAGEEVGPDAAEHVDETAGGNERILVVEDEELVRLFVRRALEGAGYETIVACDGQEALEIFRALEEPVDLVLTDVVMPRMKGTELAARLARLAPDLPVLYMSGYLQNQALGEAPDVLLHKPFSTTELCGRVRRALDQSFAAKAAG